jgi:cytochrome oxidase Cu insertion factor (SCO1/SenC/PrrC family)
MRPYQAVLIAATGLIVAAIAAFVLYGGGGSGGRGVAAIGGPFTLTDQTGKTRTEQDLKGSYNLIYFGYTFCPDVCPTALQVMTSAMDRLDKNTQQKITPVFITIDPTRDTVEQLRSYVENFHPRMIGLTGTNEQIAQAARAYRVYYAKSKDGGDTTEYLMDHSSIVFLIDPDGLYVTHFTHATEPDRMAETLRQKIGG